MFPRYSARYVTEALTDTPVVFLMGARQVGKTTLARQLIDERWEYITFDDAAKAEVARADPVGFIRNLPPRRIALDEVQRVPETLLAIKQEVDEDRTPGRFLLTGSANALLLPTVADALVGRMEAVRLATLSECEITGREPSFLRKLLRGEPPVARELRVRDHLAQRIVTGCFPEPLSRESERRIRAWHRQYANTLSQRDLTDLARIGHLEAMARLLQLVAVFSGKLVNLTALGGRLGLHRLTAGRYLALLEQLSSASSRSPESDSKWVSCSTTEITPRRSGTDSSPCRWGRSGVDAALAALLAGARRHRWSGSPACMSRRLDRRSSPEARHRARTRRCRYR